jgi:hypothetical protein
MSAEIPKRPVIKQEANPEHTIKKDDSNELPKKEDSFKREEITIPEPANTLSIDDDFKDLGLDDELLESLKNFRAGNTNNSVIETGFEMPDIFDVPQEPVINTKTDNPFVPEPEIKRTENTQELEIPYDEESSYFFMYGVATSGKTVILSGLFYNLLAHRLGDNLKTLNDNNLDYQKKGTVLMDQLLDHVSNGVFPPGTSTLNSEGSIIPRQVNLEFKPKDPSKSIFKFTMMDFSGEDLMKVNYVRQ